ncbi:MAG: nitrilase-related carbon-nitrogen hydrolase [Kluyvera sp.]|uniref:nitrilase-related carbon-nitrogen hydrolase n=1 Tax=Kluyvera sp. TaxID=1538228 RepID=UPI003A8406CC
MLTWTIAAAQYAPRKGDVAENIIHHLRFIDAAAEQACKVLIFPELSLTGPNNEQTLPAPPCDNQLQPLHDAAQRHQMTIIAGLPMENDGKRIKGIVIFAPDATTPRKQQQGHGTCLAPESDQMSVFELNHEGCELSPQASLLATVSCMAEPQQQRTTQRLQRFAHKYAIAVLKSNYASGTFSGGSALWDENGQLIVRADGGELLLTGRKSAQGWQGEIIPLR